MAAGNLLLLELLLKTLLSRQDEEAHIPYKQEPLLLEPLLENTSPADRTRGHTFHMAAEPAA